MVHVVRFGDLVDVSEMDTSALDRTVHEGEDKKMWAMKGQQVHTERGAKPQMMQQ